MLDMPSLRFIVPLTGVLVLASSCTVLFDYGGEENGSGGAGQGGDPGTGGMTTTSTGGSGGGASCTDASECDDGNDCTSDECTMGSCVNDALADGEPCSNGTEPGSCLSGECVVACTEADPSVCDDDNVCTVDGCDTSLGQCTNEPVADGEADITVQTDGDCKVVQCVAGQQEEQNDDGDVPVDNNPCTDDLCTDGNPSNPNVSQGTSCGGTLVCDGNGVCVGCNQPSDCPGQDTFCQTITCVSKQCGVDYTANGTALPQNQQTAGPCKEVQCNGSGGTKVVNAGGSCDDGLYCNGTDSCLSGNCSQHSGDPCPGPDGDSDCSETCDETNDACSGNDVNGSVCNDGQYCNGADTCQGGSCSQHAGNPCPGADGDGDCSESCNESADNCNGNDPSGSSCNDNLYCNGQDTCNGSGSCANHTGDPCNGGIGGSCMDSCSESADACTAQDPEGSTCIYMQTQLGCCGPNGVCYSQCV